MRSRGLSPSRLLLPLLLHELDYSCGGAGYLSLKCVCVCVCVYVCVCVCVFAAEPPLGGKKRTERGREVFSSNVDAAGMRAEYQRRAIALLDGRTRRTRDGLSDTVAFFFEGCFFGPTVKLSLGRLLDG